MSVKKITPKELHEKLQSERKLILLDVRAEEKYNDYHIEAENTESRNIPKTIIFGLEETGDHSQLDLPNEKEIVVTCTTGNSAAKCANILSTQHDQILLLEGGITAWKEYVNSLKDK